MAVIEPMICHCMFWKVNLLVLAKKLYQLMITFETTMTLTKLIMKQTMTVGICLIDSDTSDDKSYSMKLKEVQITVL